MQGSREWTMLQGTAEVTCSVSKLNTELAAGHFHNDTTVSSICPNYDLHFAAEFVPHSFQFKFQQQLWSFCILTSEQMVILMMLSVGSFVIAGCLHGQIHHMMLSFVQYLHFLPSATIVAVATFVTPPPPLTKAIDDERSGTWKALWPKQKWLVV